VGSLEWGALCLAECVRFERAAAGQLAPVAWPGVDGSVERVAGAGSARPVPVAVQGVVGRQLAETDAAGDELLRDLERSGVRVTTGVRPDDGHAVGHRVVVGRVGTDAVPASTLVGIAVLSNEEVVADVSPAV